MVLEKTELWKKTGDHLLKTFNYHFTMESQESFKLEFILIKKKILIKFVVWKKKTKAKQEVFNRNTNKFSSTIFTPLV